MKLYKTWYNVYIKQKETKRLKNIYTNIVDTPNLNILLHVKLIIFDQMKCLKNKIIDAWSKK